MKPQAKWILLNNLRKTPWRPSKRKGKVEMIRRLKKIAKVEKDKEGWQLWREIKDSPCINKELRKKWERWLSN